MIWRGWGVGQEAAVTGRPHSGSSVIRVCLGCPGGMVGEEPLWRREALAKQRRGPMKGAPGGGGTRAKARRGERVHVMLQCGVEAGPASPCCVAMAGPSQWRLNLPSVVGEAGKREILSLDFSLQEGPRQLENILKRPLGSFSISAEL